MTIEELKNTTGNLLEEIKMNIIVNEQTIPISFSQKATILNSKSGILSSTVTFTPNARVMDEPRGFLKYVNNQWVFCGLSQINPATFEKLALVLESPHKNEFSPAGIPLRPANGTTGNKINNLLADVINNRPPSGINQKIIYKVYLINAIQYQTSCYQTLHAFSNYKNNWHTIRNNVFKALWNNKNLNIQQDLKNRINVISPSVIMNCVTGGKSHAGLKRLVELVIKSNNLYPHPSTW